MKPETPRWFVCDESSKIEVKRLSNVIPFVNTRANQIGLSKWFNSCNHCQICLRMHGSKKHWLKHNRRDRTISETLLNRIRPKLCVTAETIQGTQAKKYTYCQDPQWYCSDRETIRHDHAPKHLWIKHNMQIKNAWQSNGYPPNKSF